ncbi:cyclin-L1-1, partial [Trifolium medium]|nr:cyclin-L1-1 [Trifolium medium]
DRIKSRNRDQGRDSGRDSDKECELEEAERFKLKDHGHRSWERAKDLGHSEKSKHYSSHDRDYYSSSYSSREKDRHRHH